MRNWIFGILIILSTNAFGQKPDCKKFKNGKFKIIDSKVGNSIIERKGSKQTEYGEKYKLKLQFEVKWIDDCTYTLKLKKVIENPNKIEIHKDMILTVEIIEVKEKSYLQKTSSNQFDLVLESEIFKIE